MPLLILPFLVVLALFAVVLLVPVALVQRYRVGTARQRTRGWLATLNIIGLAISGVMFAVAATVTTMWVPETAGYSVAGLVAGVALGVVGLQLTRWEPSPGGLYYTPNRLLVLTLMLLIAGRLMYSVWRGWESWRAGIQGESWFVAAGVAGSMAAGAVVLSYYVTYWAGVRRRHRRHAELTVGGRPR